MSNPSCSVISNLALLRLARMEIHCLFLALPMDLPRAKMMHFAECMETMNSNTDLAELIQIANQMQECNPDMAILNNEKAQCVGLSNILF